MKDLLSDDGSLSTEEQLKGKVSRRGFLRLASVAAGGSVAALACGVDPTLVPATAVPPTTAPTAVPPTEPAARSGLERTTPVFRRGRSTSKATVRA